MKVDGIQMIKELQNPEPLSTDIWIDKILFITQTNKKNYQFKCVFFSNEKPNDTFDIEDHDSHTLSFSNAFRIQFLTNDIILMKFHINNSIVNYKFFLLSKIKNRCVAKVISSNFEQISTQNQYNHIVKIVHNTVTILDDYNKTYLILNWMISKDFITFKVVKKF